MNEGHRGPAHGRHKNGMQILRTKAEGRVRILPKLRWARGTAGAAGAAGAARICAAGRIQRACTGVFPAGSGGLCLRHAPTRRRAGPGRFALLRTGICRHRCGRKRPFQCGGILSGAVPSALPRLLQTVCTHISALLAGAAGRAGREPFLFWKAVCGAGRLRRPGRRADAGVFRVDRRDPAAVPGRERLGHCTEHLQRRDL